MFSTSDRTLAARLEAAEAANVAAMARSMKNVNYDMVWQAFGGGVAVFAGSQSPMTHALGIGMAGPVSEAELEAMEEFFRRRGSSCVIDLCPLADASVISFVQARPYHVTEFNNVMVRRIRPDETFSLPPAVRSIAEDERLPWARRIGEAFSEYMPLSEDTVTLLALTCKGSICWSAGEHAMSAGAAMGVADRVALFYADATLVADRRKGWQSALIHHRLAAARDCGCDLAMASVLPGSVSHRNYERAGFELLYMRVNLGRDFDESRF